MLAVKTLERKAKTKIKITPSNFEYIFSELKKSKFDETLKEKLVTFHSILPLAKLKPTGSQIEHLIQKSLSMKGITCSVTTEHEVGADLVANFSNLPEAKISMKSGQINFKTIKTERIQAISLSSYRTSSYNTLSEKISYAQKCLLEEDIILSVIAQEIDANKISYAIYGIDPKKINLTSLKWQKNETSNQNIRFTGTGSFIATFNEAMSGQLWLNIPLSDFKKLSEFIIAC